MPNKGSPIMLPVSFPPATSYTVSPGMPVHAATVQKRQGRNLSTDAYKAMLERMKHSDAEWQRMELQVFKRNPKTQAYEYTSPGLAKAFRAFDFAGKPATMTLKAIMRRIKRVPLQVRSYVMGTLRGIRFRHQYPFHWMPGIQNHIARLHTVNHHISTGKKETIVFKGKPLDVPFHHFQLAAPKSKDGTWNIPVFGDPGYPNGTLQANVDTSHILLEQLGYKADAVILTGDVGYASNQRDKPNSLTKSGDTRLLRTNLYEPYKKYLKEKAPLFMSLGNNDSDMGHDVQYLNYLNLPRHYQVSLGDKVDLFFVDTATWSPTDARRLDKRYNTTHYSEKWDEYSTIQQHWLNKALEESKTFFPNRKRLIISHFPISPLDESRSASYVAARRDYFENIINRYETYGVDGFINGHVHQASAQTLGGYKTMGTMKQPSGADSSLQPDNTVLQITNGCSSHYEYPDPKNAFSIDTVHAAQAAFNAPYVKPMPTEALFSDTSFGLLQYKDGQVTYAQVAPPMNEYTCYDGDPVMLGNPYAGPHFRDDQPTDGEHKTWSDASSQLEHVERFRVLFRLPFERGGAFSRLAFDHTNPAQEASKE
jgi:predicted phosphodiesterase